mgnify:FL=1
MRIPKSFTVGQQEVKIIIRDGEDMIDTRLGQCDLTHGKIIINNDQTPTSMENTCIHEMIHSILDTMGNYDLSHDEVFVSTFAAFALEIIKSAKYE